MIFQQMQKGAVANLPVAASVCAYGSVLGVLAAQKNLSWLELLVMNLSVFAGSAQFVMVDMWGPHLPVLEMIFAVMIINLPSYFPTRGKKKINTSVKRGIKATANRTCSMEYKSASFPTTGDRVPPSP